MIDVNAIISGEFAPTTALQAVEASVVVQRQQDKLDQGKSNVFGYFLVIARNHYVEWAERSDQINDPETSWHELAGTAFKQEMSSAIAAGEAMGYTSSDLKTAKNAVRTLYKALNLGANLVERDDATGNFVLSGKTAIEQWNKQQDAESESARDAENAAKAAAMGFELHGVEGEAEAGVEFSDPEIQALLDQYISNIHELLEVQGTVDVKDRHGNVTKRTGREQALRSLNSALGFANTLVNDFQKLKQAAANDSQHAQAS